MMWTRAREKVKARYRSAQIKAAIKVNAEQLRFNWELGRDLVRKKAEERWGAGVVEQLSLDLQAAFPEKKDLACGLFITTRDIYDDQTSFDVPYLNANMRMINCSRSGIEPLKFWWLIKTVGDEGWTEQARMIMENTEYLKKKIRLSEGPCHTWW